MEHDIRPIPFNQEEDCDYELGSQMSCFVKAVSRIISCCVFVLDPYRKEVMAFESPFLRQLGYSSDEIRKNGIDFLLRHTIEEERKLFLKAIRSFQKNYLFLNPQQSSDWVFSFHFHFLHESTKYMLMFKSSPLSLSKDRAADLFLCTLTVSGRQESGHASFNCNGGQWEYLSTSDRWEKIEVCLSKTEFRMLRMAARGMTRDEIGKELCMGTDNVKRIRKRIFEALNVHNVSEAISVAHNLGLI